MVAELSVTQTTAKRLPFPFLPASIGRHGGYTAEGPVQAHGNDGARAQDGRDHGCDPDPHRRDVGLRAIPDGVPEAAEGR